ncbi:MAG: 30S ribosomal protein S9 [bacterium]
MTKKEDRYYGLGRRKSAIAQVFLVKGGAEKKINGVMLEDYFDTISMRTAALAPLILTSQQEEWGVKAKVMGGGKRGQADAVKLGVARALIKIDLGWRTQLKAAGMLTRDARVKERKKFGLKRARRAPQFSKR